MQSNQRYYFRLSLGIELVVNYLNKNNISNDLKAACCVTNIIL